MQILHDRERKNAKILTSERFIARIKLAEISKIWVLRECELAGAGGFEPPHADTKNRCLTAWRRPNWFVARF